MIYIFHEDAGKSSFTIEGETYKYLVKVRRHGVGDTLHFRNKSDIKKLHSYKITAIQGRNLSVEILSSCMLEVKAQANLHIGWCQIDAKSIEKVLATLSEIGVAKISFITCQRSQKNFKLDFKRFERILEASMQQCGRSSYIEFDSYRNIKEFLSHFPQTKVFDFCDNPLKESAAYETVLIGCEGGFTEAERELLAHQEVFSLHTPMVLRSESAVMAVASKILL